MKKLFLLFTLFAVSLNAQHWYSMDINVKKGRQNDLVELFDNYLEKFGTNGMQVFLLYNDIGNHKELSTHQLVWLGDLQTISDGLGGKFNNGSDSTLFWKRVWEMAEFVQDYTGEFVAQQGDVTDVSNKLQFVWAVKANNPQKTIQEWTKAMKKINPNNSAHMISAPVLNAGFGGANLYGLSSSKDYKSILDELNMIWSSKEWSEFQENHGGSEILMNFSRQIVKSWN